MSNNIKAEIVAHSLSPQGEELMSVLGTFPRIILAEVNTHRMLSKNTSSSRAIPYSKMVKEVRENPFIPIAWQKNHPGMQGTIYLSKTEEFMLDMFMDSLFDTLMEMTDEESPEYLKLKQSIDEKVKLLNELLRDYEGISKTLDDWWLFARDKAVEASAMLYLFDTTKQLCNRLLEPFMWTTMLLTGSKEGWDNFFKLRCPVYQSHKGVTYKSWKDLVKDSSLFVAEELKLHSQLERLQQNGGQAEIHIMDLAEKIYDARNESTPKQLKPGEWHIPFRDKIIDGQILNYLSSDGDGSFGEKDYDEVAVQISTAMAARTSYTVVGDEKAINYENMIALHDRLLNQEPPHSSPFEHTARAMNDDEYTSFIKGNIHDFANRDLQKDVKAMTGKTFIVGEAISSKLGWCYNLKGFIPYRYLVDNKLEL